LLRSRRLLCTSLAALVGLGFAPPAARADHAAVGAYREAVARGSERFDAGDYAGARADFQSAYELHPEPLLLFNIASTFRREGERERAIELYRAFLERAPADDPRRALAATTIAELEQELAAPIEIEAPPEPPRATTTTTMAPPRPAPAETGLPAPPAERPAPPTGAVLRGAGLACLGAALVGAGGALLAARDISRSEAALEALGPGSSWGPEEAGWYARGEAAERRLVLWSAAGATLATSGAILYLVGHRRRADAPGLVVAPGAGGGVVSWSGRW
jgi:tetratricopeptide (TPR) repeat protein